MLLAKLSNVLRGAVIAGLVVVTAAVLNPDFLVAGGDCEDACMKKFGNCITCAPPWDDYNGEYTRCVGTSCYFACGSTCQPSPH